jgi:DNA-directed RNA polymerase subunit RPC12/RpoP
MIHSNTCSKCNKDFRYDVVEIEPFEKEKMVIRCPYCDEITDTCMTSGFVHSFKIGEHTKLKLNK